MKKIIGFSIVFQLFSQMCWASTVDIFEGRYFLDSGSIDNQCSSSIDVSFQNAVLTVTQNGKELYLFKNINGGSYTGKFGTLDSTDKVTFDEIDTILLSRSHPDSWQMTSSVRIQKEKTRLNLEYKAGSSIFSKFYFCYYLPRS